MAATASNKTQITLREKIKPHARKELRQFVHEQNSSAQKVTNEIFTEVLKEFHEWFESKMVAELRDALGHSAEATLNAWSRGNTLPKDDEQRRFVFKKISEIVK